MVRCAGYRQSVPPLGFPSSTEALRERFDYQKEGKAMTHDHSTTRRNFLKGAGISALGIASAAGLAACAPKAEPAKTDAATAADSLATTGENSWLEPEPQISADQIAETVDADVVVCGGGTAGLFAACAAAEEGAKTVMLEQFAKDQGSGVRDDIGAYNTRVQQESNCPLDPMDMLRHMQSRSSWFMNQRLFNVWKNESAEALNWYADRIEESGFKMKHQLVNPPADQEPSFSCAVAVDWGVEGTEPGSTANNGQYILNPYAESIGVDCRWETKLIKCIKEGDRVTGVIAQNAEGDYVQFNASKGVILCCGGYLGNPDMMEAIQPDIEKVTVYNFTWPGTNGDGIKAGLWAGAAMDPEHSVSSWEQGLIPPDKTTAEAHDTMDTFWTGPLPFLRVNLSGERFMNESSEFDSLGHALHYQPGHTAVQVLDASWKEDAERFNVYGAHRYFPYDNGIAPLFTIDLVEEMMAEQIENGLLVQADTIDELAEKIGVPTDALVATVKRYNDLCEAGVDEDFGKPAYRMSKIDEPPFIAARFAQQGSHTMDGLVINEDMQVLDADMNVIPGLYAAGDNSGCYLGVTYLGNAAGNAAGRSVTFGRHAGRHAAQS